MTPPTGTPSPPSRHGSASIGLGMLALFGAVGLVFATRWMGPINRPTFLLSYAAFSSLHLLGALVGVSGWGRSGRSRAVATLGLALNVLLLAGLSVLAFLVLSAGA